jgi:hypothetical protein
VNQYFLQALGTAFMPVTPSDCIGSYLKKAGLAQVSGSVATDPLEDTKIARENWLPFKLYAKICRVRVEMLTMIFLCAVNDNVFFSQLA